MSDVQIKKTMLVLKNTPASITSAEMFLKNRDWTVYSTCDLKEAISLATEKTPSYFLVCADHPNSKVSLLPKILKQSLSITVIAFIEKFSSASENALISFEAEYRVAPPATGPAIERCVNKHLRSLKMNTNLPSNKSNSTLGFKRQGSKKRRTFTSNWTAKQKPKREMQFENPTETTQQIFEENLIETCAEKSLKDACLKMNFIEENVELVDQKANALCVVIESSRFSGYIVVGLNTKTYPTDKFITNFKTNLFAFLKSNGERIIEHEPMPIFLNDVELPELAESFADFVKIENYKNDELVAAAFFPRPDIRIDMDHSDIPDMKALKIEDLIGDHKIDFNLYIYLPQNKKLILCTAIGDVFEEKQKARYMASGLKHMHVKKEEMAAVTKYYAENYLNSLADDFYTEEEADSVL